MLCVATPVNLIINKFTKPYIVVQTMRADNHATIQKRIFHKYTNDL